MGHLRLNRLRSLKRWKGGNTAVLGSYNSKNVGDLLIGQTIRNTISRRLDQDKPPLFSDPHDNFKRWDHLILGGGGILQDYDLNTINHRINAVKSAPSFSVHGVGVPGLHEYSRFKLKFLNDALKISVRDSKSKEILSRYVDTDIEVTADPVFMMEERESKEDADKIGVNFRPLPKNIKEVYEFHEVSVSDNVKSDWRKTVKEVWEALSESQEELVFVPFSPEDVEFANSLGIPSEKLRSPQETVSFVDSECKAMVCNRYHSLVVSSILGKEVMPLTYAPKVDYLCEYLGLDFYRLSDLPEIPEIKFQEVNQNKVDKLRNKAEKDFDSLIESIRRL